jgi:hypothetical protein
MKSYNSEGLNKQALQNDPESSKNGDVIYV